LDDEGGAPAGCGFAGKSTVNKDWQLLQRPRMVAEPAKRLSSSEYLVKHCGHWTIIRVQAPVFS
jgi:hypothetical protein